MGIAYQLTIGLGRGGSWCDNEFEYEHRVRIIRKIYININK